MNIDRFSVRNSHTTSAPTISLSNELVVVFGPHSGVKQMLDLTARLSLNGPLYLLDCGNRSNMYRVAKLLRTLTNDPATILKNIKLSRAFTCYQVTTLLEKIAGSGTGSPVLVLDLLATFMDESVHVAECSRLFGTVLQYLEQISRNAPVIVSAKPLLSISVSRLGLLEELRDQASQIWEENILPSPRQPDEQLPLLIDF